MIKHELKVGSTTYIFYGATGDEASLEKWRRETLAQGIVFGVKYGPIEGGHVCTDPRCQRWEGLMAIAPILGVDRAGNEVCTACGLPVPSTEAD